MPIICKHPYWQVSLDLDYYISRVNITAVMQIFTGQKKSIIKKEAITSTTNQEYNKLVTKEDKASM